MHNESTTEGTSSGWTNILALLPATTTQPPLTVGTSDSKIPLNQRLALAAEWLLPRLLAGESPTACDVVAGVEQFRATYKNANAVGTLLGRGVRGKGLNLFRRNGQVLNCYENARKLAEMLEAEAPDRLGSAAQAAGFSTPAELADAILTLKKF
jgi:hypothetical protein